MFSFLDKIIKNNRLTLKDDANIKFRKTRRCDLVVIGESKRILYKIVEGRTSKLFTGCALVGI